MTAATLTALARQPWGDSESIGEPSRDIYKRRVISSKKLATRGVAPAHQWEAVIDEAGGTYVNARIAYIGGQFQPSNEVGGFDYFAAVARMDRRYTQFNASLN